MRATFLFWCVFSLLLGTAVAQEERPAPVYKVPIDAAVDETMVALVLRAIREAEAAGATHLVLAINTPGGDVDSMTRIIDELDNSSLLSVAWVTEAATSAGAILAVACDYLLMRPYSTIGSSMPVQLTPFLPVPVDDQVKEKFLSYVRGLMRAKAQKTQRNEAIVEAMIDPDVVLYEVLVEGIPDVVDDQKYRELVDLHGEGNVQRRQIVCKQGKLLNLTAQEAEELRFSDGTVNTEEAMLEYIQRSDAPVVAVKASWSEHFARFLSSEWVQIVLFVLGAIGIFMELKAPGLSVPGLLGATCIGLLLFGKYLVGLAELTEILLIVAGFILIAVELFVMPGTLIPGIAGAVAVIAGVFLSFQSTTIPSQDRPWASELWWQNLKTLTYSAAFTVIGMVGLTILFPKIPVLNRVMLRTSFASKTAKDAATSMDDVDPSFKPSIGAIGTAQSPLRPAGKILVEGHQLDAVAEGQYVDPGVPIRIVRVQGNRIVVRQEPLTP